MSYTLYQLTSFVCTLCISRAGCVVGGARGAQQSTRGPLAVGLCQRGAIPSEASPAPDAARCHFSARSARARSPAPTRHQRPAGAPPSRTTPAQAASLGEAARLLLRRALRPAAAAASQRPWPRSLARWCTAARCPSASSSWTSSPPRGRCGSSSSSTGSLRRAGLLASQANEGATCPQSLSRQRPGAYSRICVSGRWRRLAAGRPHSPQETNTQPWSRVQGGGVACGAARRRGRRAPRRPLPPSARLLAAAAAAARARVREGGAMDAMRDSYALPSAPERRAGRIFGGGGGDVVA